MKLISKKIDRWHKQTTNERSREFQHDSDFRFENKSPDNLDKLAASSDDEGD